jgi:hypothetical protein
MALPAKTLWAGADTAPLTAAEQRTLTFLADSVSVERPGHWRWVVGVIALLITLLYLLPTLVGFLLLQTSVPWSFLVIADLAGCLFLYLAGLHKPAVAIYVTAHAAELLLLWGHILSPARVILFADMIPTLCALAFVLSRRFWLPSDKPKLPAWTAASISLQSTQSETAVR